MKCVFLKKKTPRYAWGSVKLIAMGKETLRLLK